MEKPVVRISVRNLVEFILRSGDLDSRRTSGDKEAMQKGSRIHRKIQKQMGGDYQAEVSLKKAEEYEDLIISVEGRADGIFQEKDKTVIDEIKGIYASLDKLEEPVPVHRGQAMCYAYIYAEKMKETSISIQMTYANLDTEEIKRFREEFTYEELKSWYINLLAEYYKWVSFQQSWKQKRNQSTKTLEFPFAYRAGQKRMVSSVYHTIHTGKQIFIQAPTGVGKTMSAIFPSVRAVGEGEAETIFYLTAKTITRTVAEEAFSILQQKGLFYKVITITAKEKLCLWEKIECRPDKCPYAKGHYDRVNEAVFELFTTESKYDRNCILEQAEKWQVCPFELSLDLSLWADTVICDYNYVFDPNVHLKRFFGDSVNGKYLFLIDEAHNLVERGREMYSAFLCKEDVLEVKNKIKPHSKKLARALERVNKQLLELKKSCEGYEVLPNSGVISLSLLQVMGEMDTFMEDPAHGELTEEILDFYFQIRDFLYIDELVNENYVVYTENGEDGKFRLKLFCVNPGENLSDYLNKGVSTIFFSATLLPMMYYQKLLSIKKDDYGIYVASPFECNQRCILNGIDVSSRYTRRGYEEYRKIAEYIARTIWQKKGNYMIFFPSYKLMEDVYQIYEEEFSVDWVQCIKQSAGMMEREREEFLERFSRPEGTLAGFCVLGGVFSEGIDLMGDRLIGAIVVGTGLSSICNEREILKKYYDSQGENGFDYAYRFPGMNKVLQAAGRVIRTDKDEGIILLLDERFHNPDYQSLFPVEWADRSICRLENVEEKLRKFWDEREAAREEKKPKA